MSEIKAAHTLIFKSMLTRLLIVFVENSSWTGSSDSVRSHSESFSGYENVQYKCSLEEVILFTYLLLICAITLLQTLMSYLHSICKARQIKFVCTQDLTRL